MNNISVIGLQENEFDRIVRDAKFLAELAEQNRAMERYVNESLISASGNNRAINEMTILQEAALGDKIKNFFTKIKNFFKKIFDKLGASLNALFLEQKKYIEKYQYIITKCKYQAGDVDDMYDHFTGLNRIVDAVDNAESAILSTNMDKYFKAEGQTPDPKRFITMSTFDSADTIKNFDVNSLVTSKPEDLRDQAFTDFISTGYWANAKDFVKENGDDGKADPAKTFRNWFNGSADTQSWDVTKVEDNFQYIINTVYGGASYLTKLEKIVSTVQKKMDEAAKVMEDYYKAQQDKILTNIKSTDVNNKAAQEEKEAAEKVKKAEEEANKAKAASDASAAEEQNNSGEQKKVKPQRVNNNTEADNSSAIIYNANSTALSEDISIGNSSSNNSSSEKGASVSGGGAEQNTKASDANTKLGNQTVNKDNIKANNKSVEGVTNDNRSEIQKKAEEILNKDITNRQAEVNADVMISTSITTNMFNSFKLINKDYFSILQAHVQWYLSNPGAEKNSENITTRTRNLNMNSGSVEKKPENTTPAPEQTNP